MKKQKQSCTIARTLIEDLSWVCFGVRSSGI